MNDRTKENVYDDLISPLMADIIAICKRASIPFHAGFALDGDLRCTTHVPLKPSEVDEDDRQALDEWTRAYGPIVRGLSHSALPFTITRRDKDGNVDLVEVVYP